MVDDFRGGGVLLIGSLVCGMSGLSFSLGFLVLGGKNLFLIGLLVEKGLLYSLFCVKCFLLDMFLDGEFLIRFLFLVNKLVVNDSVWSGVWGKFFMGFVGDGRVGDLMSGGIGGSLWLCCSFGRLCGVCCGWGNLLIGGGK